MSIGKIQGFCTTAGMLFCFESMLLLIVTLLSFENRVSCEVFLGRNFILDRLNYLIVEVLRALLKVVWILPIGDSQGNCCWVYVTFQHRSSFVLSTSQMRTAIFSRVT